jgi:integrase
MGATWARRSDRKNLWVVTLHHDKQRERVYVHSERDAKDLCRHVLKQEALGVNVIETMRAARTALPAPAKLEPQVWPMLRVALPEWLEAQARAGDLRQSTANHYTGRLSRWLYAHRLDDGRLLGDLPVNAVTREHIGAVIRRIREAGRSLGIVEAIRNSLSRYYASIVRTPGYVGENPTTDLREFIGRGAYKRAKARTRAARRFFSQEEGPQLFATTRALHPRWSTFILTGVLGGLRWGESAALRRSDIDWTRGRIHVQRTLSDRGHAITPCKDSDDRWVKASPALLGALKAHCEAMALEGQVNGWTPEQREWVFPTVHGRPLSYVYFQKRVWAVLLAKAGLPYRRYHSTRHTYATWLLSDGADLRWVQHQLGHSTVALTADTYGHMQPDRHEAAAAGLDRYLTF